MSQMLYFEALNQAIKEEMARDSNVVNLGLDVELGYVFQVTKGLIDQFGEERIRDTPLSELSYVGAGVGAALGGLRPVVEIQFSDFIALAMDQIVNQAAKARYMSGGQVQVPLVIRAPMGYLGSWAAQHSQCLHAWFAHVPGLRVALPSSPKDAKGGCRKTFFQETHATSPFCVKRQEKAVGRTKRQTKKEPPVGF